MIRPHDYGLTWPALIAGSVIGAVVLYLLPWVAVVIEALIEGGV